MKFAFSLLIAAMALAAIVAPATSFAAEQTLTAPATTIDRDKPRVPGGSGCDDPDDIIEHPECR